MPVLDFSDQSEAVQKPDFSDQSEPVDASQSSPIDINSLEGRAALTADAPQSVLGAYASEFKDLGAGVGLPGKVTRAALADAAAYPFTAKDESPITNVKAAVAGDRELPIDTTMAAKSTPTAVRLGYDVAGSLEETAPKLLALPLAGESLLAQGAAAGGLFGFDSEGNFSPKLAIVGAFMPGVSKSASKLAGMAIAKGIEAGATSLENPLAQKTVEAIANQAALNAYMAAADSPELIKQYQDDPEQFKKSLFSMVGQNLAFGLIGATHEFKPSVESATQKFINNYAVKSALDLSDSDYANQFWNKVNAKQSTPINPITGKAWSLNLKTQPTGEPNAETIRGNQEVLPTPGGVNQTSESNSGGNVEQKSPGQPEPLEPGEENQVQNAPVIAQPNPPLTAEQTAIIRPKLEENIGGRNVVLTPQEFTDPHNSHLNHVLGKGAPTWQQLADSGIVTATPADNGAVEIKLTPSNLGGAQENLPAAEQAISKANNSRESFLKANGGVLPTPETTAVSSPAPIIDSQDILGRLAKDATGQNEVTSTGQAFALSASYTLDGIKKALGLSGNDAVTALRKSGLLIQDDQGNYALNHEFYPTELANAKKLAPPVVEKMPGNLFQPPVETTATQTEPVVPVDETKPAIPETIPPVIEFPAPEQRYRLRKDPHTVTIVERLPQSAAEKISDEHPVRIKYDQTGEVQTVMEHDLTPVKTRTAEEKTGKSKRDLDKELIAEKLDPSVFQTDAQKREALNRARGKRGDLGDATQQPITTDLIDKIAPRNELGQRRFSVISLIDALKDGSLSAGKASGGLLRYLVADSGSSKHPLSEIVALETPQHFQGRFSTVMGDRKGRIEISLVRQDGTPISNAQLVRILNHELIHNAVTSKLSSASREVQNRISRLFRFVTDKLSDSEWKGKNALKNEEEFFAEAFSSAKFRRALAAMDYSMAVPHNDLPSGGSYPDISQTRYTAFGELLRIIKSILKIPEKITDWYGNTTESITALDEAISLGQNLDNSRREARDYLHAEYPLSDDNSITETKSRGIESIREMFNRDDIGLDSKTRAVWQAFLNVPALKGLDWNNFEVEMRQRIEYGLAGAHTLGLVELSANSSPQTFPHEMFHELQRLLPLEISDALNDLRLAELKSRLGDNIPPELVHGTMTTNQFLESGLPRELYPLINPDEYLANFAGKKFSEEDYQKFLKQPEGFLQNAHAQIQKWIRALVNTYRRIVRTRPDLQSIYEDLLNGRWQPTPESGAEYERRGSLISTQRQLGEVSKNEDALQPQERIYIDRSAQAQNAWVKLPGIRSAVENLPEGVRSKLKNIFQARETAFTQSMARAPQNVSLDAVINDPQFSEAQNYATAKDIVDNNILAENQIAKKQIRQQAEVEKRKAIIQEEANNISAAKSKVEIAKKSISNAVSDYERLLVKGREGSEDLGRIEAYNAALKRIRVIRDSSIPLERLFDELKSNVPDELLGNPETTPAQIVDAYRNGRTDEQMAKSLGVSPETIHEAAAVLSASTQLKDDLAAAKVSDSGDYARSLDQVRNAANSPNKLDTVKFLKVMRESGILSDKFKTALSRSNGRLQRALTQLDEWNQVGEVLKQVSADPSWRAYRESAYKLFDVRKVVNTYKGTDQIMANPLTGEEVTIPATIEVQTQNENIQKIRKLFADAETYLANPDAENYDPKTAAAWRAMLANAEGFWLNPDINPAMPRLLPMALDLPAALSSPTKVLRGNAGGTREGREVQVKLNALSAAKKQIESLDHSLGQAVDNRNQMAAASHNMSLQDWDDLVWKELVGTQQYAGQIPARLGDTLISGEKVTVQDIQALDSQKAYTDRLRNISEKAQGNAAVEINPSRIVKGGISRRAAPTSPTGYTMPGYIGDKAFSLLKDWKGLTADDQRINFLNDPDHFRDLVIGHVKYSETPKYAIKSELSGTYRGLVDAYKEGRISSIQDAVNYIYNAQKVDDPAFLLTRDEIQSKLLSEVGQEMSTVEKYQADTESERAKPKTSVYTADNAFTKARAENPSLPFTLMDYGVVDPVDRMKLSHDAMAFYVLELLGKDGAFDRLQKAFQDKSESYEKQQKAYWKKKGIGKISLFPTGGFVSQTASEVSLGNQLYDYNQVKRAARRIASIKSNLERIYIQKREASGPIEQSIQGGMKFIGANVLMTPSARITHTLGNVLAWGTFYKKLGQSLSVQTAKQIVGLTGDVLKRLVLAVPKSEAALTSLSKSNAFGDFASKFAQNVLDSRAESERLKELGIAPTFDNAAANKAFTLEASRVLQNTTPESPLEKGAKLVPRAIGIASDRALQAFPALNDAILNGHVTRFRETLTDRLKANAIEYLQNRKELSAQTGHDYTDLTDPKNFLTSQELTGGKGGSSDYAARRLRSLFGEQGMSLDRLMMRYHQEYETAKAAGKPTNNLPFLTPDEQNTLDFAIGQETGLSTAGTRNLASQGSSLRSFLGYIHGLPTWQLGNFLEGLSGLSNKTKSQHTLAIAPAALAVVTAATILGIARQYSVAKANKILFNQSTTLPQLGNVRNAGDAGRLAARALASWVPIVGDVVNGVLLNQPDRFGHLDSMFIGWNMVNDVLKTASQIVSGHDVAGEIQQFVSRWSPMTRILINRMESRSGNEQYYNAMNAVRASLPEGMEAKSRQMSGQAYQAGPLTPFLRLMVNAAFNGDDAAFNKAKADAIAAKVALGSTPEKAELAVREAFAARNPWLGILRTLPTDEERAQFFARMTPEQQKEVLAAEATFVKYSTALGSHPAFTVEQRQSNSAGSGGFGSSVGGASSRISGNFGPSGRVGGGSRISGSSRTSNRIRGRGPTQRSGSGIRSVRVSKLRASSGGRVRSGSRNRIRSHKRKSFV